MRRRTLWKYLIIAALVAVLAFIWLHSAQSRTDSRAESDGFVQWLLPVLKLFFGEEANYSRIVRKTAHFVEFAALGGVMALIPVLWRRRGLTPRLLCAFGVMMVALTDETVQIFSHRGSMVKDVWLDFAGGIFGLCVMTLLVSLVRGHKRKR